MLGGMKFQPRSLVHAALIDHPDLSSLSFAHENQEDSMKAAFIEEFCPTPFE
jgi:hypothetical protein